MHYLILLLTLSSIISLSSSIQWTNAGGNPLWEEPRNWDLTRVPTSTDDVIIDLANIPADVRIGGVAAFCRSLTIGGTSAFGQFLTVQGSLTVGSGGGKILPNGNLNLNAAPSAPFSTAGTFDGVNKLIFYSGSLSGSGSFTFSYLNLSGPALKQFNSSVTVSNTLVVDPGRGSNGVINIAGGTLNVPGTLKSTDPLTISSADGASLNVGGTFTFQAFSAGYSTTIRGKATIGSLSVMAGTVTLNDEVTVMKATVSTGATISVIGAGTATRKFGDITGMGSLKILGGTNYFTTLTDIGNVDIEGGSLVLNSQPATINNFLQNGGILQGSAPLILQTATFSNAQISGIPITVTSATFQGFTSLSAGSITITNTGVISKLSQLTMINGAQFVITSSAVISQSASFKLLPGGTNPPPPTFTHNGRWTSTSDLEIVIDTYGNGNFQLATGSTTTITGIKFTSGSLVFTSSSLTITGATFVVDSIAGTGNILSQGDYFTVNNAITASTFTQTSGMSYFGTGSITTLDIQVGTVNITGPLPSVGPILSINTFKFEGGTLLSISPTAPVSVGQTLLTGTQPKTFSSLTLSSAYLTSDCGVQQCQIFTLNAHIIAGKKP